MQEKLRFEAQEADLSAWTEYFTETLARTFEAVAVEARRLVDAGVKAEPDFLRCLDRRARAVLALFTAKDRIASSDVAEALGLSDRMARVLLKEWTAEGWLEVADPSRKARAYVLSAEYRQYMDGLSAIDGTSLTAKSAENAKRESGG